MRVFSRLVLFLYGILIAMVSVIAVLGMILISTEQVSYGIISEKLLDLLSYEWSVPAIVAIFLVIFVISIKIAFRGMDGRYEREAIIKSVAGGEIAISLDTFESIVTSTLRKILEAKEYTTKVRKINEGVTVSINLSVLPEVNIPELGANIQKRVIEAIESMTNVKVIKVRINVDNVSTGFKSKLE